MQSDDKKEKSDSDFVTVRFSKPTEFKPSRRKTPRDLAKLARAYTREALDETVHIMRNAKNDSDKLKAVAIILDRGYGKAPLKIEISDSEGNESQRSEFQKFFESAAERAVSALRTIPQLPAPAVDVTPFDPLAEIKSEIRTKSNLALEAASSAGIPINESRLESSSPQHDSSHNHTRPLIEPIPSAD